MHARQNKGFCNTYISTIKLELNSMWYAQAWHSLLQYMHVYIAMLIIYIQQLDFTIASFSSYVITAQLYS